jgi:glutamate racemase
LCLSCSRCSHIPLLGQVFGEAANSGTAVCEDQAEKKNRKENKIQDKNQTKKEKNQKCNQTRETK